MNKEFFEKTAAFIFLLLIIGMLAFFTFVEIPKESKQIILIIIGVLMGAATNALPKLFGTSDKEKENLMGRVKKLEQDLIVANERYLTLERHYSELMKALVEHHVIYDKKNDELNLVK